MTTATINQPEWIASLKAQDAERSTGLFDLRPASKAAALTFAINGGMKTVSVGDTLWIASGGYVTVERVTKSLIYTTGGRFHRSTGALCGTWSHLYVVAIRTSNN